MMRIPNPPKEPQCCCRLKTGMLIFGVYWIISSLCWVGYLIWCMVEIKGLGVYGLTINNNNNLNLSDEDEVNAAMDSKRTHLEVVLGLYLAFTVACIVSAGLLIYGVRTNNGGYMLMCLILQGVDLSVWAIWLIAAVFFGATIAVELATFVGVVSFMGNAIVAVVLKVFFMCTSVRYYIHINRPPQSGGDGPQMQDGHGVVLGTFPEQSYNDDCESIGDVIGTPYYYDGPQIQDDHGVVFGTFPEQPYNDDYESYSDVIGTPYYYDGPQMQDGHGVVLGTFPEQPYNDDCEMLVEPS